MRNYLLVAILVVGTSQLGWTDEPASIEANTETVSEVKLVDGTLLKVSNIRKVGTQFIFTLENGSMVSFRREDVDLSTLPNGIGGEQSSFGEPRSLSIDASRSRHSQSLGGRKLNADREDSDSESTVIQIVGDPNADYSGASNNYEAARQKALDELESLAELYSERAAELTKKMREYVGGCYGSTTTYHQTETSGSGYTTGTVDSTHRGAWVAGNSNGTTQVGGYAGSSHSEFEGWTVWSQESNTTSTTINSETPYCMGLFGEIKGVYNSIGPLFTNAIVNARYSHVLDSETNAIFSKHGIGTTDVWMLR